MCDNKNRNGKDLACGEMLLCVKAPRSYRRDPPFISCKTHSRTPASRVPHYRHHAVPKKRTAFFAHILHFCPLAFGYYNSFS